MASWLFGLVVVAAIAKSGCSKDNATDFAAAANETIVGDPTADIVFQSWKVQANPSGYVSLEEERYRYGIYLTSGQAVNEHNAKNLDFKLALNKFADRTADELKMLRGLRRPVEAIPGVLDDTPQEDENDAVAEHDVEFVNGTLERTTKRPKTTKKPKTSKAPRSTTSSPSTGSLDWRTKGAVTPVKDQGNCGSCWSFSAIGALEGRLQIKSGKLVSLSEQNVVDCASTKAYGNDGCNGGYQNGAFKYVKDAGGLNTEAAYPYKANKGKCQFNSAAKNGPITGFKDVPNNNDAALAQALQSGPVAVSIDASQNSFMLYSSGIYSDPKCSSKNLDHAVLLVGYGSEGGKNFWIVKNSWGKGWGEQGYIRFARGGNTCGILSGSSYPILA